MRKRAAESNTSVGVVSTPRAWPVEVISIFWRTRRGAPMEAPLPLANINSLPNVPTVMNSCLLRFELGSLTTRRVDHQAISWVFVHKQGRRTRLFRSAFGQCRMKAGTDAFTVTGEPRLEVLCGHPRDCIDVSSVGFGGGNGHHEIPPWVELGRTNATSLHLSRGRAKASHARCAGEICRTCTAGDANFSGTHVSKIAANGRAATAACERVRNSFT